MANSISTLSLIFLLLLLFAKVNNSIATSYHGVETIGRKTDCQQFLHEIIFDLGRKKKNMQISNRRALVDADRVAPGGPDPQHHVYFNFDYEIMYLVEPTRLLLDWLLAITLEIYHYVLKIKSISYVILICFGI
ncbi:CLAVATA3/ESR (CLE)-related protein 5-like [Capsicum galapagoense]